MAVITISRESGSGGGRIAQLVAASLGYHLVDDRIMRLLLEQYGMVDFEEVYNAAPGLQARFVERRQEVTEMLNRILMAVAHHGNAVILGRGGFAALREVADVLNVRVQAPLPVRARRMLEDGTARDIGAAEEMAKEGDKRRATFVKLSYGLQWDSTGGFDLVVDTAKLSVETSSALIARAALALRSEGAGARLASEMEVESVMADAISEGLGCRTPHRAVAETTMPHAPA